MVIECIVICMDNSDYMRNEDYVPSRLMAQCEAADFIVQAKLRSHPENQLALVTFSNHEVIVHLTTNQTKLLTEMYRVKLGGSVRFLQGLSVAQLVLKHRLVKNHKCRIVAFVGSPVEISENEVQNVGKRFKKENVGVDVIRFGCEIEGSKELEQLVAVVNGPNGNSNNFIRVPSGANLADTLVSSNVIGSPNRSSAVHFADDDDADLRAALEMSLRESGVPGASAATQGLPHSTPCPTGIQDGNQLSDEEQLALAIQLSLQAAERVQQPPAPPEEHQEQPERDRVAPPPSPPQQDKRTSGGPQNKKGSEGSPGERKEQGSNGKSESSKK